MQTFGGPPAIRPSAQLISLSSWCGSCARTKTNIVSSILAFLVNESFGKNKPRFTAINKFVP